MGKGDKRTKRGKIFCGSYGNSRKRKLFKNDIKQNQTPIFSYKLENSRGEEFHPSEAVFPILTGDGKKFIFVGTGFFINAGGGFVTAKHVLYDKNHKIISPFLVIHGISKERHVMREVESYVISNDSDAAICMLKPYKDEQERSFENVRLTMKNSSLRIGDKVKTIAYPRHKTYFEGESSQIFEFVGDWKRGQITAEFPKGRDKSFLPGACFQTSILILGGASGGPVLNEEGFVVGINSSGYDLTPGDDQEPISFITPISEVFSLKVPIARDKEITIEELSSYGGVIIR